MREEKLGQKKRKKRKTETKEQRQNNESEDDPRLRKKNVGKDREDARNV